MLAIRVERDGEASAIGEVTTAAFRDAPHSSGAEAVIVAALRRAGALALSLVAVDDEEVVGHVAFSPVAIDGAQGWFGLGPVSVRPDRQGAGLGAALIRAGLERLREQGAAGCVVLGEPAYYGRFGFAADPRLRFGGAPPEYFQRLVFHGLAPMGEVAYHMAFDGA
jgi:putative acetyltransferase